MVDVAATLAAPLDPESAAIRETVKSADHGRGRETEFARDELATDAGLTAFFLVEMLDQLNADSERRQIAVAFE
jgi:hypothetical protein